MMTSNYARLFVALFVAVAALGRHAARCLPSTMSSIKLTEVQVINKHRPHLNAGVHGDLKEINARAMEIQYIIHTYHV